MEDCVQKKLWLSLAEEFLKLDYETEPMMSFSVTT